MWPEIITETRHIPSTISNQISNRRTNNFHSIHERKIVALSLQVLPLNHVSANDRLFWIKDRIHEEPRGQ